MSTKPVLGGRTSFALEHDDPVEPRLVPRLGDEGPTVGRGRYVSGRADDLCRLHRMYASTRDRRARDELVAAYDGLAVGLARRFPSRRERPEDLVQVARIGLLAAIDRFDPDRERPFAAFARATITGELKRHVRDRTWAMHVPRSLQEHWLVVVRTVEDLTMELGRSPRIPEVAARSGLSDEEILEAMELTRTHRPAALELRAGDTTRVIDVGADDDGFARCEDYALLRRLLAGLDERDRLIVGLRFVDGFTQSQIAARLGVSQMWVSRKLRRILDHLRAKAVSIER